MSANKTSVTDDSPLRTEELAEIRNALLERRERLTARQASQLDSLGGDDKHHLADLEEMGDTVDTDSACEIMDLSASTIDQIDRALLKIADGSYGACEACAETIRRVRLKFLPFAPLCVDCQRKVERSGETLSSLAE